MQFRNMFRELAVVRTGVVFEDDVVDDDATASL
jgi:hypothetical protein